MRRWRGGWILLALCAGCANDRWIFSDDRPLTSPAPVGVQQEIRDARFFLAYPESSIGPATDMRPKDAIHPASSR